MARRALQLAAVAMLAACGTAAGAEFTAEITDQDGRPVADAVVMLVPEDSGGASIGPQLDSLWVVDQRDEVFIPFVTIVPRGGSVVFTNNDRTMHQVYSFSETKQFELTLAHEQESDPVVFDRPGVAALGCNIHDHMIAYVFVADSPWTARTGSDGRMQLTDVPAGNYRAHIWHPRLPPVGDIPTRGVVIGAEPATLSVVIGLLHDRSARRMHRGDY